jgi:hypothetical protein
MALQPFIGTLATFSVCKSYTYSVGLLGRGDQPVARPLPTHTTAQTQNKRKHTSRETLTHDPSVCASENTSSLTPRGHCDRQK